MKKHGGLRVLRLLLYCHESDELQCPTLVAAKGPYGLEGQLHTVMEKSPESSPTTKPRQGGGFSLPPSPTGPTSGPAGPLNGTSATENGHQNNSSPLSHSAYLASASSQIRTRGHEADR